MRTFWLWKWRILGAYDGDGIKIRVHSRPPICNSVTLRFLGVDTPEMDSALNWERDLAIQARDYLRKRIRWAMWITVKVHRWGKYGGRTLATVKINGKDIAQSLIEEGLGVYYDGGKKVAFKRSKMRKQGVNWKRFLICAAVAVAIVASVVVFINGAG